MSSNECKGNQTEHFAQKFLIKARNMSLKEELFNLRFQLAINQLENPMRIVAVKKDIARIKTVIRENEIKNDSADA